MTDTNTKWKRKRRWLGIIGCALLVIGLWQVLAEFYREEDKELRHRLRQTVKEKFPQQAAEYAKTVGLFFYRGNNETDGQPVADRKSVVLIHGLDDPGKVWQNLAPQLAKEGYNVWLMQYPNDQPVAESALLFFEALQGLRHSGIEHVSIVAHSMGGLVSREMLTSPDINYKASARTGQVPQAVGLIMVGTPNYGSQLARLRLFAEWRDHLARLTKGEGYWLGSILDGAGEAKIDLLPGSLFLTNLNARPHPSGVEMLVIAGITSPWQEDDIKRWVADLQQKVSGDQQQRIEAFGKYMISMTHGLGDGLVTVESARLEGVPLRIVSGTHLSMIRNVTAGNPHIPPAVPVIMDLLQKQAE